MKQLFKRTAVGVIAGALLYLALNHFVGMPDAGRALEAGAPRAILAALALSLLNYLLRFAKWELAIGWLNVRDDAPELSRLRSLVLYAAGLSMAVTPGKIGEVLRSVLLRTTHGVPIARTAPIVLADRLSDVIALALLCLVGITEFPRLVPVVVLAGATGIGILALLSSRERLHRAVSYLTRFGISATVIESARMLIDSASALVGVRRVFALTSLSVLGWGLECVGFWLVMNSFTDVSASLALCTLLWAGGTLVGAISLLPGGLGATEAGLALGIPQLIAGVSTQVALAATVIGRLVTLWFGVAIGVVALLVVLSDPSVRKKLKSMSWRQLRSS